MKLACVIHRFGADIAGGSESHCRAVAQHLAETHDVTVLTSCARDHVTWDNHYPAGDSMDGRLRVRRFPTVRRRNLARFRDISRRVFSGRSSNGEQDDWFRENGPLAPALLDEIQSRGSAYDRVLFWSYRYFPTYFGLPMVADRAILLPTAEEDPLIRAAALEEFFQLPAGYLFLTPEEADLVAERAQVQVPASVIGCGIDPVGGGPVDAAQGRHMGPPLRDRLEHTAGVDPCVGPEVPGRLGITDPFVLYLGRVDPNKGCESLLRYFARYVAGRTQHPAPSTQHPAPITLVLAGPVNMPVPAHPSIRTLGFVDDDVRDALLSRARVLLMPSPYESLSMVLLEAWNRGVPVLVNARCAVLRGQVRRANGGLHYRTGAEFAAALDYLLERPDQARTLGAQGQAYVEREYRWPTVMGKIERVLADAKKA